MYKNIRMSQESMSHIDFGIKNVRMIRHTSYKEDAECRIPREKFANGMDDSIVFLL